MNPASQPVTNAPATVPPELIAAAPTPPAAHHTKTNRSEATRAQTNCANAALSTGPTTPEGKRTASLNAIRHGLTGRTVVLPGDDLELYRAFCQRFADELEPSGVLEESMVQTVADSGWRLDRSAALEANLLSLDLAQNFGTVNIDAESDAEAALTQAKGLRDTSPQLVRLSLYSQRISRLMQTTLAQLREIQKERREREAEALDQAADLHKLNQAQGLVWEPGDASNPSDPFIQVDGFEFSVDEIDVLIDLQSRLDEASHYVLHE
jgi:hypothetical protein